MGMIVKKGWVGWLSLLIGLYVGAYSGNKYLVHNSQRELDAQHGYSELRNR
jgi:hypothetical protein